MSHQLGDLHSKDENLFEENLKQSQETSHLQRDFIQAKLTMYQKRYFD